MSRKEIGEDRIWTIPAERYKTKRPNHVPLSKRALAIIEAQPKIDGCDYVFPSRANTPFSGFARARLPWTKPCSMPRLLQPFQHLHGTRTNHASGNGLGLAIVDAIASAHRATLSAQPRPDGGLTIEVTFPL